MRRFGLFTLSLSMTFLSGSFLAAGVIDVFPTGDVDQDGDNIQAAVDGASPGDTIVLKSGTFVLGRYLDEDAAWVNTKRGSFRYFADFSAQDVRDPDINPFYWDFGGGPNTPPFPQVVVVDKPVMIVGEDPPGSTVITTVNQWTDFPSDATLFGDANSFLVSSAGVTLKNLTFHNMHYAVRVVSGGSVIEDNVFDTCGHYTLLYYMDEYSFYPNLPSYNDPVKSYARRNVWLNAIQGIHLFGSEVVVEDNLFELRATDGGIPWSYWAVVLGGLPDFLQIPGVFTWSVCRDNDLLHNTVEGDPFSFWGAFYLAGYGAPIVDNKIEGNTVQNMWAMVESHGQSAPVENNLVSRNGVTGGPLVFDSVSFGVFLDGSNVIPQANVFSDNLFVDVPLPSFVLGGRSNRFLGNDYSQAGVPGWPVDTGSVLLGPETTGNFILENLFPEGTSVCDQVLDLGSNAIIGGGVCKNNSSLAPFLHEVHQKQLEKLIPE